MSERLSNGPAIARADEIHAKLARGWNTWDTRSVLRHVLLPEGLGISLSFAANDKLVWVKEDVFFGRFKVGRSAGTQLTSLDKKLPVGDAIEVRPGLKSYDGTYSEVELNLRGARVRVETCAEGREWCAVVTCLDGERWPRVMMVEGAMVWGREGVVRRVGDRLVSDSGVNVFVSGEVVEDPLLPARGAYVAVKLDGVVVVSSGRVMAVAEAQARMKAARAKVEAMHAGYGEMLEAHEAMQTCLAWNVVYEPRHKRVITTVARDWNCIRGGYAVFCWDSFFMAWMMHLDAPEVAYATFLEAFREMINGEFVANIVQGTGRKSADRSQPPVGSVALLAMMRRGVDESVVRAAWPALLTWNRWWEKARMNARGTISLGSNAFEPVVGDPAEFVQPATAAGAAIESGLDNAAIYDGATIDKATEMMEAEDVGMTSLYVADCEALAEIGDRLGKMAEAAELRTRGRRVGEALAKLWVDSAATFLNRSTKSGEFVSRQILTSYYPMYCGVASRDQSRRMVTENLAEPKRYAGEWLFPVSPRDDGAFEEQLYLRGRVWPPTNLLVYLGLKRCGENELAARAARRSVDLIVENWRKERVVAENYSAIDGTGGRVAHTHPLHGWGGLFALIGLMEGGRAEMPFGPNQL